MPSLWVIPKTHSCSLHVFKNFFQMFLHSFYTADSDSDFSYESVSKIISCEDLRRNLESYSLRCYRKAHFSFPTSHTKLIIWSGNMMTRTQISQHKFCYVWQSKGNLLCPQFYTVIFIGKKKKITFGCNAKKDWAVRLWSVLKKEKWKTVWH